MKKLSVALLFILLITSCKVQQAGSVRVSSIPSSGLIHNVYFWFTEDTTDEQMKVFEQGLVELAKVPSIAKFYWGPPAKTELREVVDNTYDYAINVFFESVEKQEAYQIDPLHLKFVKDYEALFEKVIVYDNEY